MSVNFLHSLKVYMDSTLGERINELVFRMAGGKNNVFAKKAGFSASLITNLANDPTKKVQSDILQRILLAYPDVNANWLLTGQGQMLTTNQMTQKNKGTFTGQSYNAEQSNVAGDVNTTDNAEFMQKYYINLGRLHEKEESIYKLEKTIAELTKELEECKKKLSK